MSYPDTFVEWIVTSSQAAGLMGLGMLLLLVAGLGALTDWRARR